jgi:hypothetical protein
MTGLIGKNAEGLKDVPPSPRPGNPPKPNSPPPHLNVSPNVWVYEGEAYDFTDFINKHPGGEFFIGRMRNRDVTTIVNIFHRNPEKVKRRLKKYALGRPATHEDMHPKYNAPPFLFRPDFDAWRDTPRFQFDGKSQLLDVIRLRLNQPEMVKKVAHMDRLFDGITLVLGILYVLVEVLRLSSPAWMPAPLFVPLMVILRIALSGAGHYLIHRPQVGITKALGQIFDLNYMPMTLVVLDGHTLIHHPYAQSEVDIKRTVFTGMLDLPRFFRVPIHTVHKFGQIFSGMMIRTTEIWALGLKVGIQDLYGSWKGAAPYILGSYAVRFLLLGEFFAFLLAGDLLSWILQFVITLWLSQFMIVASHDFHPEEADTQSIQQQDWAVFQIENAYDLTVVGNKYIDCFLSAGLSPHRVHHVLPQQKSGYANLASEEIVREAAAEFGVAWLPPKNFFVDRMPDLIKLYLLVPSFPARMNGYGLWREHFDPRALRECAAYMLKGFKGIGSI